MEVAVHRAGAAGRPGLTELMQVSRGGAAALGGCGGCGAGTPLQRALAVRVELTWEHRLLSCAGDERQQPVVGDNGALGWLFWAGSKRG